MKTAGGPCRAGLPTAKADSRAHASKTSTRGRRAGDTLNGHEQGAGWVHPLWTPRVDRDMPHEAWDARETLAPALAAQVPAVAERREGRGWRRRSWDVHNRNSHSRLHGGDARAQIGRDSQTGWTERAPRLAQGSAVVDCNSMKVQRGRKRETARRWLQCHVECHQCPLVSGGASRQYT